MKLIALALLVFGSTTAVYGQDPVDLIESTLKLGISEEKEFFFGFAEGDKFCFIKRNSKRDNCLSNYTYEQVIVDKPC